MSTIENEAWVEAVARALAEANGFEADWPSFRPEATAAVHALAPLIIERCAEEAEEESCDNSKAGRLDEAFGAMGASNRIRALIQKEASDA